MRIWKSFWNNKELKNFILFMVTISIMSFIAHEGILQHIFFICGTFLACIAIFGLQNNRWPGEK